MACSLYSLAKMAWSYKGCGAASVARSNAHCKLWELLPAPVFPAHAVRDPVFRDHLVLDQYLQATHLHQDQMLTLPPQPMPLGSCEKPCPHHSMLSLAPLARKRATAGETLKMKDSALP